MERLRATESAYDRALSVVSHARHEINNSLMGILAHLEILLAQEGISEAIRGRAEILVRETEKIRDRIADLETIRRR
jgi:signal transduction histidine kinase